MSTLDISQQINAIQTAVLGKDVRQAIVDALNATYNYASNEVDYSIQSLALAKQRAELIENGDAITIDSGTTPSVIFNSDSSGHNIFAMAGGIARQVILPSATQPLTVSGDPSIGSYVVQYLVVTSAGTPTFKRYSLLADDDFIIGILYGNEITLYYNQYNGEYQPGEVIATQNLRYFRKAKKLLIPKGAQITKDQNSYYVANTQFFDVSETDVSHYYVMDRITLEVYSLAWKDVSIMSQKYIIFGYSFRGQVYIYGQGFLQDAYYMKKGWTNDAKRMIQNSIKNPFVRTNVKLVGDSITAGAGGTGYSQTGTLMFTDTGGKTWYENLDTATCWANMLKTMMADYSGDTYVEPLHKGFYWNTAPVFIVESANSKSYMSYQMVNIGDYVAFTFYGDKVNINFSQSSNNGMANIYIDGVLNSTFDGYASAAAFNVWKNISGLTKGYHTCIIEVASTKNASSTGNRIYFNGVTVTKEISVKNWGASGQTTQWVFDNLTSIVQSTDDLFFLQIGTNDRKLAPDWVVTSMFQRGVVEAMLKNGSDVIVMTANSGTTDNEMDASRLFHSNRVADENLKVALEYNLPYISNYNAFLQYTLYPNALYTDLMYSDGTHPNDKGHKLMFRNICNETGLNTFIGQL